MKYNVGMYGGSFDPLHLGHVNCILEASMLCEELYIVLSYSKLRDSVNMNIRYRWLNEITKHMDNVFVIAIEDECVTKSDYDEEEWLKGADKIKHKINKHINVVFCGSDYSNNNIYQLCYKDSVVYKFNRNEVPISSTELRNDTYKYWNYLPNICKEYYTKKVLIVGGESTGKSTLTQNLAAAYNTNFVEEVGRETCARAGGEEFMTVNDLYENFIRQKALEIEKSRTSNKLLFIDTDAITTNFYSKFLLTDNDDIDRCNKLSSAITSINEYDMVIFLEPTVEFIQDGTRSEVIKQDRIKYSEEIKKMLNDEDISFYSLGGDYHTRFNIIKDLIYEKFNIRVGD